MKIKVPTINLILCLSEAVDLISPLVADHHKRVACIAYHLSTESGLPASEQKELAFAGALHDVGGLTLNDRLGTLQFDFEDLSWHSEKGYLLLNTYKPFSNIALLVRYHHTPWNNGNCNGVNSEKVPFGSHLLNLADRVSVLLNTNKNVLSQVDGICKKISEVSGEIFMPELVDAFMNLSKKEYFWLDIKSVSLDTFLKNRLEWDSLILEDDDFLGLIKLFSRIIDFRSRFTSTHSSGVAATAEAISKIAWFTEAESQMMKIAGYIHDLGKLAVPVEILEKPTGLTKEEFDIVRTHTYYTDQILEKIKDFDVIRSWGALHHERMDGKGYPFHLKGSQMSLGSRIMAVADVFVALTEDRPYRKGMCRDEVLLVIQKMADSMALDSNVVSLMKSHYDDINLIRINAQDAAVKEYQDFMQKFSV